MEVSLDHILPRADIHSISTIRFNLSAVNQYSIDQSQKKGITYRATHNMEALKVAGTGGDAL